jgi:putative DNA primase/helicase
MDKPLTDPKEFIKFNALLLKNASQLYKDYSPFFFVLEKQGKDPLKGTSWKLNRKTFLEALYFMRQGYNIAIAATKDDPLVIVDVDDLRQVPEIKPTLKTRSRKRIGEHNFYFTIEQPGVSRTAKRNIATDCAGEVRSSWQYVVAAGSFVQCTEEEILNIPEEDRHNAGKYTVAVERTPDTITFEELPDVYKEHVFRKERELAAKQAKQAKQEAREKIERKDDSLKSALWDLTIYDITGHRDDPTNRFSSPFHDSKTYKDTSVNNGLLHCWRHMVCHNAITYLAVESGISTCNNAGYPHGGGTSSVDMSDPYTVFTIWKYAKDKGFIPGNDPVPYPGLVYYAMSKDLCSQKDLQFGWKLPGIIYHLTVLVADREGINLGR